MYYASVTSSRIYYYYFISYMKTCVCVYVCDSFSVSVSLHFNVLIKSTATGIINPMIITINVTVFLSLSHTQFVILLWYFRDVNIQFSYTLIPLFGMHGKHTKSQISRIIRSLYGMLFDCVICSHSNVWTKRCACMFLLKCKEQKMNQENEVKEVNKINKMQTENRQNICICVSNALLKRFVP